MLIADLHRWRNAALFARKEKNEQSKTSVFSIDSIIECVYVRKEGRSTYRKQEASAEFLPFTLLRRTKWLLAFLL